MINSLRRGSTSLLICLSFLLVACDGGISGTGSPEIIGSDNDVIENCVGICPEGSEDQVGSVADEADVRDIEFTNNENATVRVDAIVNVLYALSDSNDSVILTNQGNTSNPIIAPPGLNASNTESGYFSLLADTHDIDFVLASMYGQDINAEKIAGVNPLVLSSGSASSILIRGSGNLENRAAQAMVLRNKTSTQSMNTVQIRIVHAAANFADTGNLDLHINPVGQAATNSVPIFEDFSYTNADTGYIVLPVGSYQITATDRGSQTMRIVTLDPITPAPSGSLTLIIRDDPSGVAGVDTDVMIINDGDTSGLAADN